MMRKLLSARLLTLMSLFFVLIMPVQAQTMDEFLSIPNVDDIYVARLDVISDLQFGKAGDEAYGLLKVVEVEQGNIVVITSQTALSDSRAAFKQLESSLNEVQWDEGERISIPRSKLGEYVKEKNLLGGKRDGSVIKR